MIVEVEMFAPNVCTNVCMSKVCILSTGAMMTTALGAIIAMSKKQKINTKRSKLVGVNDTSTQLIWTNFCIMVEC